MTMKIDNDFSEKFELADGRTVLLRLIRPEDKDGLAESLSICSQPTLYNRFMGSKPKFTDAELKYLTECDSRNHVAFVGLIDGQIVAVGRAIRYGNRPTAADIGIIVADAFQGKGIGSYILGLLMIAMIERGVAVLCGNMFSTNNAMFRVIDAVPFSVVWELDGALASFEIDLTSILG
jgi:RimJ/RimL family protein N-acetyltransferase